MDYDISNDGPTGQQQDILCWVCNRPLVSREYLVLGKRLWSTIHPNCEESARKLFDGPACRFGPLVRKGQKICKNWQDDD